MNSVVENLGIELSENEFELILNQKLSPRIKTAIRGYKHENLKALFANLLNIYDSSETHHEAFSALVNQKSKFSNLHDFTEETLRLLSLSRKNSEQQSQLFVHSVENVVPKRVYEKLLEFLDSYELLHNGRYPELPILVDFVYKYRQEIDTFMSKNYKGHKFNFAQTESDDEQIWNKKVLEKIIKPRIREIGDGSIHGISFKRASDDLYPRIKIIFKTSSRQRNVRKYVVTSNIREMLTKEFNLHPNISVNY